MDRAHRLAVLLAAIGGHLELVGELAEAGADDDRQDRTSVNPLLHGCIEGDLGLVRTMLGHGADIERLTRFGGVGLSPAAEKGHVEVVRELVTTTDINLD